jgi:hypothetical protein
MIPKRDGKQRPLAIAALEDKIVQKATLAVLNSIYEEDFLGFSYGFRPRRSQTDLLDALVVGISACKCTSSWTPTSGASLTLSTSNGSSGLWNIGSVITTSFA